MAKLPKPDEIPKPISPHTPAGRLFTALVEQLSLQVPLEPEVHIPTGPETEESLHTVGVFPSSDPRHPVGILLFSVNDDQDTDPCWAVITAATRAEGMKKARRMMAGAMDDGACIVQQETLSPAVAEMSVWRVEKEGERR